MRVLERTRVAYPTGVLYVRTGPVRRLPGQGRLAAKRVVISALAGAGASTVALYALGWPWWASSAVGLAWAVLAPVVFAPRPQEGADAE